MKIHLSQRESEAFGIDSRKVEKMVTIEVIKKFMESNWIIERAAREVLERLPLRFRYGISYGPTFRYWLGFLRESEKWDRDRLEAYQFEQLKDLLIHSGKNVPYYRKIFREYGFKPEKVQSLEDIKVLPYTDKELVRDNIDEFIAANIQRKSLFRKNTSGSTGIPLTIYSDKEAEEKHWATVVHAWGKVGYSPNSKMVTFWGNISRGKQNNLPWKRYANQLILSRHYFNNEWMNKFAAMIKKFKPQFIYSLPSSLVLFSNFMRERAMPPFEGIEACIVESEAIYPWQREIIEKTFNTRIYSTYGIVEKVIYADECINSFRYHIYPQYGVSETIPVKNGTSELVGTGLINYANPLIRYRTADISDGNLDLHRCSKCNSSYQTLELLEGRLGDLLIDKDGTVYTPVRVGVDSNSFENVKMFQFYQDSPGKVILRLVRKESCSDPDVNKIKEDIITSIGLYGKEYKMEIEIVFVKDVHMSPAYKFSMVEQRLDVRKYIE